MRMHSNHRYSWIVPFILIMLPLLASAELLPNKGKGEVNIKGTIVDTACAIAVDNRDQTIDMEVVSLSEIIRDGQGRSKSFIIHLDNCVLKRPNGQPTWQQFQVTFDGNADGDFFGVEGDATGVALQILDALGNPAIPGSPLPSVDIAPGNMQLNYTIKLVANNHKLKAGDYFSAIRFKLDYF